MHRFCLLLLGLESWNLRGNCAQARLTVQNHCLAAKGTRSFLDQFRGEQGWVQLGQERAAKLLQLANLILMECSQSHGKLTSALDVNDIGSGVAKGTD